MHGVFAVFLFFETVEFIKNLIDIVTISKLFKNKISFPKPILYINQYKNVMGTLALSIKQNNNLTLELKIINDFSLLLKKQGNLYLKHIYISKIGCQNQALKRYRWEI